VREPWKATKYSLPSVFLNGRIFGLAARAMRLSKPHGSAVALVVRGIERRGRGRERRRVVRVQLAEQHAIELSDDPGIALGSGRRIEQDAVDALAGAAELRPAGADSETSA
jgi:hypothetical protein